MSFHTYQTKQTNYVEMLSGVEQINYEQIISDSSQPNFVGLIFPN